MVPKGRPGLTRGQETEYDEICVSKRLLLARHQAQWPQLCPSPGAGDKHQRLQMSSEKAPEEKRARAVRQSGHSSRAALIRFGPPLPRQENGQMQHVLFARKEALLKRKHRSFSLPFCQRLQMFPGSPDPDQAEALPQFSDGLPETRDCLSQRFSHLLAPGPIFYSYSLLGTHWK